MCLVGIYEFFVSVEVPGIYFPTHVEFVTVDA